VTEAFHETITVKWVTSSAEVWKCSFFCSFRAPDGFEEKTLRQRHSTGTDFRLPLMTTNVMTFLPKLRGTQGRQSMQTLDLHYTIPTICTCEMYLLLRIIVQMVHDQNICRLLVEILYGLLGKHNEMKQILSIY
jgi:hypothetical protein